MDRRIWQNIIYSSGANPQQREKRRTTRRRSNRGILRLSITDNIDALRDRLYQEIRRREKEARQKVQNQLQNIG